MIGRPKKPGTKVGYRVKTETVDRINTIAETTNKTKSAVIDEAVEMLAKNQVQRVTI